MSDFRDFSPSPELSEDLLSMRKEILDESETDFSSESSSSPELSEVLLSMRKEILDEPVSDFSSDDDVNDPEYIPENLKLYEEFGNNLSSVSTPVSGIDITQPGPSNILQLPNHLEERALPSDFSLSDSSASSTPKSKKRTRKPDLWKANIRKNLRQKGSSYVSSSGVQVPAKTVGSSCKENCFHQCNKNFTAEIRADIHKNFWKLSDEEKKVFYAKFVKKTNCEKRRKLNQCLDAPKKTLTVQYYMETKKQIFQCCKIFFLNTLGVSERRIYYFIKNYYTENTGVPIPSKLGKRGKKPTDPLKIEAVKQHINSFPVVESHYCRSSTQIKYLESHLTLSKMYSLYKEQTNEPVTLNVYRHVFNYAFNLSFHRPKKDQCDKCVVYKNNKDILTEEKLTIYQKHLDEKCFIKAERTADRKNIDELLATVCFDLQNVFSLPISYASNLFYKRKLATYNLTGTLIIPNKANTTYCSLWNESSNGRAGNDIASCLVKILNNIVHDHPELNRITLWSDSCVPQNRNQIMSTALIRFLHNNKNIQYIIQKFSEPGHSQIQEVDCVHSSIEKYLKNMEIGSPVSLLKKLKDINYENVKLKLLQMQKQDFKLYSIISSQIMFQELPFLKCKIIKYTQNLNKIMFKTSAKEINFKEIEIKPKKNTRFNLKSYETIIGEALQVATTKTLSAEKQKDLKSIIPYLKTEDQNFFKVILKI